jgi:flagellum-specific peptidoglycan hydrolase FlgJ
MIVFSNPLGPVSPLKPNWGPTTGEKDAQGLLGQMMAQQKASIEAYQKAQQSSSQSNAQFMKDLPKSDLVKGIKKYMGYAPGVDESSMPAKEPDVTTDVTLPEMDTTGMDAQGIVDEEGNPSSGGTISYGPPSQSLEQMMPQLQQSAQTAYPDNPTMQQVALTQAIQESGLNGRPSSLATQHNNYFGIKAGKSFPGTNGSVDLPTTEYIGGSPARMSQPFASNRTMDDSFQQHAQLMSGASRYRPVIEATDPQSAFQALGKSGYATDPQYGPKLQAVWQRYVAPRFRG